MFANSKKVTTFAPAIEREILDKKDGPFVYRLGRKILSILLPADILAYFDLNLPTLLF